MIKKLGGAESYIVMRGEPVAIYAPSDAYSPITQAAMAAGRNANRTSLVFDSPNPLVNLDTINVRTNPKTPDYTLGNPRIGGQQMTHHQFVIHNDAANPAVNLDTNNVRTNPKLADYMLGDPRVGGQQMTHHSFVLGTPPASSTASIIVTGKKERGGFFSKEMNGLTDRPLAFSSTKYIPGIFAPELPATPTERDSIYTTGTAQIKKKG
jgi:hypothetical protein